MQDRVQHLLIGGWCLLFIIGAGCALSGLADEPLWYDEAYTAAMAKHSMPDILHFCIDDIHPPLYYLLTRMVCRWFGVSAFTLRTVSVLGLLALAALGIGPVRRLFGLHGSLLFTALVFIMPISYSLGREARMYPWAWFFVTGSLLYGYLAITGGKPQDWLRFGALTILANYTHLHALLEMLILYTLLFLWILIHNTANA
ncbi:binding-protein-dependent transport systems inner membrane component [Candidatus Vecturithrix granuli]|uniref:Binding-protein-dependent transport systems inner membrane component n=1 Tax=Vecturithrix granuli TaxID=1499967 RepID=A0A0S6WBF6_VECG1|nr:binding-protein-dependent transport systems inner membrane component [Candidatus Vecturithrix granuli]